METRQTTWWGYANVNNSDGTVSEFYSAATNSYTDTFVDADAAIQLLTNKDF